MLSIKLPPDIEKRLAARAKKVGQTKTALAREAILERLDDLEDADIAVDRTEHPSEKIWTLEELEQGLDLES